MFCPFISCLLALTALGFAMVQAQETTMHPEIPLLVDTSCQALDKFGDAALMQAQAFTKNLMTCANTAPSENRTQEAEVLVNILSKLKLQELANLTKFPETMDKISNCVVTQIGLNFTTAEASLRFARPDILSFQFEEGQCSASLKLLECVEQVYGGLRLNATTKKHKNVYMRLFDGINMYCEAYWKPVDDNNGHSCIPSLALILSALMVFKLVYAY